MLEVETDVIAVKPPQTGATGVSSMRTGPLSILSSNLTPPWVLPSYEERRQGRTRQTRFVHDVLHSVTDGKLNICTEADELPEPLPCREARNLGAESGLCELREVVARAAEALGFSAAHLPRATLELGFTTAGTFGYGMKLMLQTADRVYLLTGNQGTILERV